MERIYPVLVSGVKGVSMVEEVDLDDVSYLS